MKQTRFLNFLQDYNILSGMKGSLSPLFEIHRTTQAMIQTYFYYKFSEKNKLSLLKKTENRLERYVEETLNSEDMKKVKTLIPHLSSFLSQKEITQDTQARFMGKLGHVYWVTMTDFSYAQKLLKKSLAFYQSQWPQNDLKIAWTLRQLGIVHKLLGTDPHKEPLSLLEKSLCFYRKHYQTDLNPEVAGLFVNLGSAYNLCCDYAKASEFAKKGFLFYQKLYGDLHVKTIWSLMNYGCLNRRLGDYRKARKLFEKGLSLQKEINYKNYIESSWSLINLGIVYHHYEDYEKAKRFVLKGLETYKKNLGEDHLETAWAQMKLASIHKDEGQSQKAQILLEKALKVFEKWYGPQSADVGWVLQELSLLLLSQKRYEKALHLLQKSFKLYQKAFPQGHAEIAFFLQAFGEIYYERGDLEEAERYFLESLKLLERYGHLRRHHLLEDLWDLYELKRKKAQEKGLKEQSKIFYEKAHYFKKLLLSHIQKYFDPQTPYFKRILIKSRLVR